MKAIKIVLLSSLLAGIAASQALTYMSPLERRAPVETETRGALPASFPMGVPAPAPYRLGALRQSEVDAVVRRPNLPLVGIERPLDAAPLDAGEWLALDDARAVWRTAIQSDGAAGVRVHFHHFALSAGSVWVYSEDQRQVFGPYRGAGIDAGGDFWSHAVFADTVVVEYLSDQPLDTLPFSIDRIAHLTASQQTLSAGTCELDATCYSPWGSIASGVGMYIFESAGAAYECSGALVNDTNNDSKPYFLTANHCISSAAMAQTAEVFWKFQTPTCNGTPPSLSTLPTTLGATYLVSAPIASGDFSLLLLSQLPNINLTFYGWNAGATALPIGGAAVGLHHPEEDYTRIMFGSRNPDAAAQVGSDYAPANMFYQIQATMGVVEPGSSGSPLFTPDGSIVGTLTYGPTGSACSVNPFTAGYGRFSVAYPSLSQYLSPAPAAAVTVTPTPASVSVSWSPGAAAPAAQNIQLSTTSAATVSLTAVASQPWIALSASSLSLSQSKPATLSVTLNVTSFNVAGTYSGSIALTGAGVSVAIPVQVSVAAPPVTLTPTPASVSVNYAMGTSAPPAQSIQLSITSAAAVSLTAVPSQPWIGLSASGVSVSQSRPAALSVAFNTAWFSAAGTYSGSIALTGAGVNVVIPVIVNVTAAAAAVTVTPAPASVSASWTIGAPAPAAQSIQLSTTAAAAVSLAAVASQPWIVLSPASLSLSQSKPASLLVAFGTASFASAGSYTGSITLTAPGWSCVIPVQVSVTAAATAVSGGQTTLIPLIEDGGGLATTFTLLNPYPATAVASLSFFNSAGAPVSISTATAAASAWQNVTIPAHGTATIATSGGSNPQKQGFALIQAGTAANPIPAVAQVGLDLVSPSVPLTPPFVVPFDATSSATTTLYIYNPAPTGSLTLGLTVYSSSGTMLGAGQIVIPGLQQGTVTMSKSIAVFAGQKGTLYVTGSGPVWSMGIRVDSGGRINMVPPTANH